MPQTPTTIVDKGLIFDFSAVSQEIVAIAKIAESYIWKNSTEVLPYLKTDLENRKSSVTAASPWGILESAPLCSIPSDGKYDRRGGDTVFGEVTSVWEIQPIRPSNWKKSRPAQQFVITGNASTRARIIKGTPDNPEGELAMWRMEIGNSDSPGCHFHVQVLGRADDMVFPKSLPVPRLPGLLITPMEVFEYVLGELFQYDWAQEASRASDSMNYWANHQKKRFSSLLTEQLNQVKESSGSPWAYLKKWKPEPDLFVA